VWGSDSWLQVSLPGVITRELGEMGLDPELGAPANLKVVMEVPRFGVSMKPRRETASFLAALFSGLKGVRLKAGSGHVRGIEPDLLSAVMIESPWRGLSHKGYAWWLLGNLYLNEVFAGGGHNRAALHCARRAYGRAAGLVLLDSNPSLFTAIHNNIGVVRYLQGMFEAVADAPERALKSWRLALTGSRQELWRKLSVRRIVSQENLAAFENLRLVQPVGEGGKTVKRSNTKSKRRKTHVKRPRSARSVGARAEKD
ncbi:MAG: hypothetical protein GX589_06225, partial [Deltaproteobacteria bacterium]|nr:hypothetical protein [Deltaproteobacteria bacterium]